MPTGETESPQPSTSGAGESGTSGVDGSTGEAPTSEGSSSGEGAVCGDGLLEGDETCDDGNTEDGDACRFDCQLPFELLTSASIHIGTETTFEVAVDEDGVAWMAGGARVSGESLNPLVLAYASSGGFMPAWHPATAATDSLSAVAVHPSGDILVTGSTDAGSDRDGTVARFAFDDPPRDPAAPPLWSLAYDGPDEGSEAANRDYAHDVAIDPQGQIYVAYSSRELEAGMDIRIAKYDPDGGELWSWTYGGAGADDDFPRKLVIAPNGDVVFGGVSVEEGGVERGMLGRLSADGEFIAVVTDLHEQVFTLAADEDGVVAGGVRWLERRSALLDEVVFSETTPAFDLLYGLRVRDGQIYGAGGISVPGEQYNAFVGAWTLEGEPVWVDTYGHESGLNDVARDLDFAPDGTLFVVGSEEVIGEDENVFLRHYTL
jgi:cysteine-rich repeat protein